jgi:hypothetical protein
MTERDVEAVALNEKLAAYAREASIALMKLSGGGSEMFKRIGDEFYAEPDLCVQRAEEKAEIIRRLHVRPEAGWQGIESAPRVHGHMILSFNRHGAMDIICWNNSTDWWDDGIYTDDAGDYPEPTHWRPLPTPPTESPSK